MNSRCILILGGARSGKSRFAQDTARSLSSKVLFVATAEPLDSEMVTRIAEHRRSRPAEWRTIEAPRSVGSSIRAQMADAEVVVVDCLTLLVSNILTGGSCEPEGDGERTALKETEDILEAAEDPQVTLVIVSNEVGLGLVPGGPLGRAYRDVLGRANQVIATRADEVYFMVAGLPLKIKG